MNIVDWLILAVLVLELGFLVASGLALRSVFLKFRDFVSPEGEGKPSALAQTMSIASDMIARSIVALAKTTFMGKQSGDVRGEQAVMGDIVQDVASQTSPLIGGLLTQFPVLSKTLKRNPQLMDFALSKLLGGKIPGNNGGQSGSPKFNL